MLTLPAPPQPVRVLLVDGQEIVRRGLAALLEPVHQVLVVGEAGSVAEAARLVGVLHPAVVLLEARLPDGSGLDLCSDLARREPAVRCLFLTKDVDSLAAVSAVGAAGHLLKDVRGPALVAGLLRAASGAPWAPVPGAGVDVASGIAGLVASLTDREAAVLRLLTDGLTNRQIGAVLFLSEKTVKNYVSGVLAKLGVQRRTQAAVFGADARELLAATR